ncbi:MAG: Gfo/Idh/MocA family oxidoreductase [Verrucomicrobia bacterium]|nr:Gfo/Idh/MocA family oxidoreductase [Verrucomicrobiota bacterium]MBI3870178.1 Gfo/Idh/MocA family oxidoreductase [Verrucomicrobiota bacterium]
MTTRKIRWGILGSAHIARKNWEAILNSGNSTLAAVASRDRRRSQQFIDECSSQAPHPVAPKALGSYEELIASPDVDAVYIPLPTGVRKEWVMKAAAAKKHVLCEKPCAPTLADLRDMVDACKRHGVQFMDGVMFMHSRRLDAIRGVLNDGTTVGEIKRIASAFSFSGGADFLTENIRMHSQLEPHGALGDLGWYCIRFGLWVMNWRLPRQASGRILAQVGRPDSPTAVPTEFSGDLLFDDGVSMNFYCSFLTENQEWAHVSGSKGFLAVPDFVLPFFGSEAVFETNHPTFTVNGSRFNMETRLKRHVVQEYSNNHEGSQETNLFRNFSNQVLSGKLNASWAEMAYQTQQVMESCLASARSGGGMVDIAG